MESNKQQKKLIGSTAYTVAGGLLMNGVLQALIYPSLNRQMGSSQLGSLLFIMGLLGIVCPSIGQALNTSRLVVRRTMDVTNGDYNSMLLFFGALGSLAALIIGRGSLNGIGDAAAVVILLLLMVFRYYGDVEYRLNLHYEKYFAYYAVLTAGYLLGMLLFKLTGVWYFIFLTGEALALAYLAATGSVFKRFFERSSFFKTAARRGAFLLGSYVITNLTLNIDRLALKFLVGDLAVTEYYVSSLLGKTLILLVAPVNTIIISFLTKRKELLNRKQYMQFTGAGFLVALVFFAGTQVGTPIFLKIFYGNLYDSVKPVISIVNASQILGLLSAYLFILVLTFTEEKWQMVLQALHLGTIIVLVLFLTDGSLEGFSRAVLLANAVRVALVVLFGLIMNGRGEMKPSTRRD
ncbi:MAG: hypothetical protein K6E30_09490 [Lachnospiraceae bacterium]|nr:hypothetical protein [Lachnospiraceae bacterium]